MAADRVLVVGGGAVGLAIAWQAAKAGADALVLEARKVGRGASWAAAGLLAAELQAADGGRAADRPLQGLLRRGQALWPAFAAELEADSGRPVGLRRDGTVLLAAGAGEAEALRALAARAGPERGFRWLDRAALREAEPHAAGGAAGGLLSRFDHQVDPRALVRALRVALERAGGEVRAPCAVTALRVAGGRVAGVETDGHGPVPAGRVVIAAGAWSGRLGGLDPSLVPPVRPVRGQALLLEGDPALPLLRHVLWSGDGYLVPRDDGAVLVGATTEEGAGFDPRHTPEGLAALAGIVRGALPAAMALPIRESWSGFRPGSADGRPILGPCDAVHGLVYATGHGHNGILTLPATVEAIGVHLVTGEADPALRPFGIDRFGKP